MKQNDPGDSCDCQDCVVSDLPCNGDCLNRDDEFTCRGCVERLAEDNEVEYETNKALGRY